jgi:hypothetical protein
MTTREEQARATQGMDELAIARAIRDGELTSPQRYMESLLLVAIRITGTGAAYRPSIDEYVWRDPSIYLNPDFLERCQGLPVIWRHPKTNVLDSKEFSDRVVGAVMLPYIKGQEVWCIARIYDDQASDYIEQHELSTSPAVLCTGKQYSIGEGKELLIEGKPELLDHIAILAPLEAGVWDKGGPPSGVESAPAEENKTSAKLDLILDSLNDWLNHDVTSESDGISSTESLTAQQAREPTYMADEAKARADAAAREQADLPKFIEIQRTVDEIAQAFGDSAGAPRWLAGESVGDYTRRLLSRYQRHSKDWKDKDLSKVHESVLDIATTQIRADAMYASKFPEFQTGQLIQRTTRDEHGRIVTKFYGDATVAWRPFSFNGLIRRVRLTPLSELRAMRSR